MECGVWVTVENGRAVKIEGDDSAWQSNGNCCTKSQASLQAAYHPDRLMYPMKRTNPKDADDPGWVRISWDEAYETIVKKVNEAIERYGHDTCCNWGGTSRQWAKSYNIQSLFDTKNGHSAVEICKGPRRMVGSLTIENGVFWMANIDYPRVYVQWGTDQTMSNYDDACRTVNEVVQRADCFISIDPRVSNCGHCADYHLALRPGTDQALALGWTNIVMDRELYDAYVVKYWSNAPFLICEDIEPSGWVGVKGNQSTLFPVKTRLLKESDLVEGGNPRRFMVWDNATNALTYFDADEDSPHGGMWERQEHFDIPTTGWEFERGGWVPDYPDLSGYCDPALWCDDGFEVTLKDGRTVKCKTVWQEYWDTCVSPWTLEHTAEVCDVDASLIEEACLKWATRIDSRTGNGGLNAQLAPEQTGNSTQTFRVIYLLFFMTGNYDVPGGNRSYTRHSWNSSFPPYNAVKSSYSGTSTKSLLEARSNLVGVDEFPLTKWNNQWTDARCANDAILTGEPYPIKVGWCTGGDFMNQSNANDGFAALKALDFYYVADMWNVPGSRPADILIPACHWLEVPGYLRGAQGAHGGLGAHVNCIDTPGEVLFDHDSQLGIYKAAGVPAYNPEEGDPWDHPFTDALDAQVRKTGLPFKDWNDFVEQFQEHGWWCAKEVYPEEWGTYRRYIMGYLRNGTGGQNAGRAEGVPGFGLPTMKCEFWSTIMESVVPEETFGRTCLPEYREPPLSPVSTPELCEEYPYTMTTGRRIPVYFHNEHRQLPWCRELWPAPRCEINPHDAETLGLRQGDWVWIESKWGKVRQTVDLYHGVKPGVINCEHSWWFPELSCATQGYELCSINCIVDPHAQDYLCGSSQLRAIPVKVYKATPENSPFNNPVPCGPDGTEIIYDASDPRLKAWKGGIDKVMADRAKQVEFADLNVQGGNEKWEVFSA